MQCFKFVNFETQNSKTTNCHILKKKFKGFKGRIRPKIRPKIIESFQSDFLNFFPGRSIEDLEV